MADLIGQHLGNYRLVQLLGRGSFAEVYLGEHLHLGSLAALKVLREQVGSGEVDGFLREARTIAHLRHLHIIRMLDFGVRDATPFLVMEYAPGGTLRQLHPKGTRLPLDSILSYVKQVASALQYAHDQHLIHRDLKPENLLLGADQEILLSDFGLAMLVEQSSSRAHLTQEMAGTPAYMAPEQFQGHPDAASDQYALGVMAHEWLCGERPFTGSWSEIAVKQMQGALPSLSEKVPTIPAVVEQVVFKALAREPHLRFGSVEAFAQALEEALREDRSSQTYITSSIHQAAEAGPRNNLPTQFTPLIGREKEVETIQHLLRREDVRLLTLTGPGGSGKTRLALQVAAELRDLINDGVYFVNLAPISDPALVLPTIAQTLDLKETREQPLLDGLEEYLRGKQLLLLLDNFEQVVGAAVQVVDLLAACPRLRILVTSRAVLHVQGEQEFSVPPLAVPNLTHVADLAALAQYEAVALFLARAQAVKLEFHLSHANAKAIVEICIRLDGLPLAIELAAARIKLLPPHALLARLGQRLAVLTSAPRDVPARQQTLRNTIKWSYDLLDASEQQLFRRLSVFAGGCTLETLEAVCQGAGEEQIDVLNTVASLIDKSLAQQREQEIEEPRISMLETVREYGLECLHESGEAHVSRQAHALYYLALAEEAEPHFKGAQQVHWWKRLEREQENLRAALAWLIGQEEGELTLRLSGALWRLWYIRGYWSEGWYWLEAALGLQQAQGRTERRAKALVGAAEFANRLGHPLAHSLIEESVAIFRELGDKHGLAEALIALGWSWTKQNDLATGRILLEESVELSREVDPWILANALYYLGEFMGYQGDFKSARIFLEESVTLYQKLKDKHALSGTLIRMVMIVVSEGDLTKAAAVAQESLALARELDNGPDITSALYWLAVIQSWQGNVEQAVALLEESLALAREQGDRRQMGIALLALGSNAQYRGDVLLAETYAQESLSLFRELRIRDGTALALSVLGEIKRIGGDLRQARAICTEGVLLARELDHYCMGYTLISLAKVAAAEGQPEQAAHLFGAAEPRLNPSLEMDPFDLANYERTVESARKQLGVKAFTAAWAEGRAMTLEQVLAATESRTMQTTTPGGSASLSLAKVAITYPAGLTAREVEVLRLVARGLTAAQVAEQLIISPLTVNTHLKAIYGKIGVSSRSAATRYAMEQKLV